MLTINKYTSLQVTMIVFVSLILMLAVQENGTSRQKNL